MLHAVTQMVRSETEGKEGKEGHPLLCRQRSILTHWNVNEMSRMVANPAKSHCCERLRGDFSVPSKLLDNGKEDYQLSRLACCPFSCRVNSQFFRSRFVQTMDDKPDVIVADFACFGMIDIGELMEVWRRATVLVWNGGIFGAGGCAWRRFFVFRARHFA